MPVAGRNKGGLLCPLSGRLFSGIWRKPDHDYEKHEAKGYAAFSYPPESRGGRSLSKGFDGNAGMGRGELGEEAE
jgi:hypothetical protein